MDVAQALANLLQDSSQVESAVVLDAAGSVLGSTDEVVADALARAARDLVAAAGELHAPGADVTRVEVELADVAVFVLREGEHTIAARTRPQPTAGLVAYDLRTCLHALAETPKARRRRNAPKRKASEGE